MDLTAQFLSEARRYARARGVSLSRLATLVINDGKFFQRVEDGGSFTVRTYERFLTYFQTHPVNPTPSTDEAA